MGHCQTSSPPRPPSSALPEKLQPKVLLSVWFGLSAQEAKGGEELGREVTGGGWGESHLGEKKKKPGTTIGVGVQSKAPKGQSLVCSRPPSAGLEVGPAPPPRRAPACPSAVPHRLSSRAGRGGECQAGPPPPPRLLLHVAKFIDVCVWLKESAAVSPCRVCLCLSLSRCPFAFLRACFPPSFLSRRRRGGL